MTTEAETEDTHTSENTTGVTELFAFSMDGKDREPDDGDKSLV